MAKSLQRFEIVVHKAEETDRIVAVDYDVVLGLLFGREIGANDKKYLDRVHHLVTELANDAGYDYILKNGRSKRKTAIHLQPREDSISETTIFAQPTPQTPDSDVKKN